MNPNPPISHPPPPVQAENKLPPVSQPAAPAAFQPPPESNANQYQSFGTTAMLPSVQQRQSSVKKIVLIVSGILIFVIVAIAAALMIFRGSDSDQTAMANISPTAKKQPIDTLDLSQSIDRQTSLKKESVTATQKQQLNLSNGKSFMVTGITYISQPPNRYSAPASGNELMKITVVFGNRSKAGSIYLNPQMFTLKTVNAQKIESVFIGKNDMPDVLYSQNIEPGKQTKGALLFEIPAGEKNLTLETNENLKNLATNQQVEISSHIKL